MPPLHAACESHEAHDEHWWDSGTYRYICSGLSEKQAALITWMQETFDGQLEEWQIRWFVWHMDDKDEISRKMSLKIGRK